MAAVPNLKTTVALTFACRELPSKDVLTASDPMVVLSRWDGRQWLKYGRTEVIRNNRSPSFAQILNTDYFFEIEQRFRCDIYDADSQFIDDVRRHDHIGFAEFTLGRLMSSPSCNLIIKLTKPSGQLRSKACIIIRGDEQKNNSDFAWVDIKASNLHKKSLLLGKDDTFITFSRRRPDGTEVLVYRSEIVMDTQNPHWRPFKVSMGALTDCLPDATFIARVTHQREGLASSALQVIGEVVLSVNEVLRPDGTQTPAKTYQLMTRGSSSSQGTLTVNRFHVFREFSFLEYLAGGLDMRLVVAVDFTASNGPCHDPRSLHFRTPGRLNEYEAAIRTVGSILVDYTKKPTFPSYGFGGQINGQPQTSHCFPLDLGVPMSAEPGVEGILTRYHFALSRCQLSGPTYFNQLISTVEGMAKEPFRPDYQHYTILLIITDGVINDVAQTIDSIVRSSDKPMSIIILGVGGANFTDMNVLDGDVQPLRSGNMISKRDITQFVPMRQTAAQGAQAISAQTLAEIPSQVTSFMRLHGIKPLPPRPANTEAEAFTPVPSGQPETPAPGPGPAHGPASVPAYGPGAQSSGYGYGNGAPPPGAPATYGAPAPGYAPPNAPHGAPAPGYGAPAPGYGAPAPHGAPAPGYGAPAPHGGPAPGYGAPAPGYGAPAPHGGPAPGYGAPAHGAPAPGYGAPHGGPAPGYGAPAPHGGPAPGYGAPAPHGGPAPGYGAPAPHGGPAPGYGAPAPHGGPAPGYGAPAPGYGAPAPHGSPAPGYGAPAPHGAPAPGYGAPAPGYGQAPPSQQTYGSNSGYPGAGRV